MTFRCSDKCIGKIAAESRLLREKACYESAKKDKDSIGMERAMNKMKITQRYLDLMEEWPPAIKLAIRPALDVSRIRSASKKAAIKAQIERVMETGIDPISGNPLKPSGVTEKIILYLIAKHDHKPFVEKKQFCLSPKAVSALKYAIVVCKQNPSAAKFLESLLAVA